MNRPAEQIYTNYTPEDFQVWETLFNRQMNLLKEAASAKYLDAINVIGFNAKKIPDFNEVNEVFKKNTGWTIEVIPNICPDDKFFSCAANKIFTSTCWLRTMAQLDYLEEPDMFHDVFGHMPLLTNEDYSNFFTAFGRLALNYIDNSFAIELLSRIYWFTIEFGLIRENGQLKIYGAGIMSSFGETKHAIANHSQKFDFDVEKILDTPYRKDILQDKYFVIDSFDQLYSSIPDIEAGLNKRIG